MPSYWAPGVAVTTGVAAGVEVISGVGAGVEVIAGVLSAAGVGEATGLASWS